MVWTKTRKKPQFGIFNLYNITVSADYHKMFTFMNELLWKMYITWNVTMLKNNCNTTICSFRITGSGEKRTKQLLIGYRWNEWKLLDELAGKVTHLNRVKLKPQTEGMSRMYNGQQLPLGRGGGGYTTQCKGLTTVHGFTHVFAFSVVQTLLANWRNVVGMKCGCNFVQFCWFGFFYRTRK